MTRLAAWAKTLPLLLGGPGVFLVAFLDGSFVTLPEINDIMIVAAAAMYPGALAYYATLITLGSVAGTYVIFTLARKGGEAFVHKRVEPERLARVRRFFDKYGILAILVPAILPPPMPFKLVVLVAGAAPMHTGKFLLAVTLGRGIRYFGEGLLALRYGEQAIAFIRGNGGPLAIVLGGLAVAGGAGYLAWRARRANRAL
ncbi:MAG: VTT domain-containing protein [Planctomycetes bacterium]|nr:VTT domain-containing protein [Planctomycetota bacterium]